MAQQARMHTTPQNETNIAKVMYTLYKHIHMKLLKVGERRKNVSLCNGPLVDLEICPRTQWSIKPWILRLFMKNGIVYFNNPCISSLVF